MAIDDLLPGVPQAKLILAGVGLALFAVPTAGLFITRHTLLLRTEKLASVQKAADAEIAAHNVTLASLSQCMATNKEMTDAANERAQEYANAKHAAVRDQQRLDALQKADKGRLDTLKALATQTIPGASCKASSALLANIRGL